MHQQDIKNVHALQLHLDERVKVMGEHTEEAAAFKEAFSLALSNIEGCWEQNNGPRLLKGKTRKSDFDRILKKKIKNKSISDKEAQNLKQSLALYHALFSQKSSQPKSQSYLVDYVVLGLILNLQKISSSILPRKEILQLATILRILLENEHLKFEITEWDTEATRTRYNKLKKILNGKNPYSDDFGNDSNFDGPVYISAETFQPLIKFFEGES